MAEPKPVTEAPKPKAKFDHAGRPVFVLVPYDQIDRDETQEELNKLFSKVEVEPTVRFDLRVVRLPDTSVIYVAHPILNREKLDDGSFGMVSRVHVSEPVEISKFSTGVDADGIPGNALGPIVDALQAGCRNDKRGRFFRIQTSSEKDEAKRTLKLLNV